MLSHAVADVIVIEAKASNPIFNSTKFVRKRTKFEILDFPREEEQEEEEKETTHHLFQSEAYLTIDVQHERL